VFSHGDVYASPEAFAHGFSQALWIAAGLSALGIVAALLSGRPVRVPAPVAEAVG
jgi:Na+/glutamate symporter